MSCQVFSAYFPLRGAASGAGGLQGNRRPGTVANRKRKIRSGLREKYFGAPAETRETRNQEKNALNGLNQCFCAHFGAMDAAYSVFSRMRTVSARTFCCAIRSAGSAMRTLPKVARASR